MSKEERLAGAHSSIVDAIAQSFVVGHELFQKFWDKPVGIVLLTSVWEKKRNKRIQQEAELSRRLPCGWEEMDSGWKLPQSKSYTGPEGGPPHGPSSKVVRICEDASLISLFLFYLPMSFLEVIAKETNRYAFLYSS